MATPTAPTTAADALRAERLAATNVEEQRLRAELETLEAEYRLLMTQASTGLKRGRTPARAIPGRALQHILARRAATQAALTNLFLRRRLPLGHDVGLLPVTGTNAAADDTGHADAADDATIEVRERTSSSSQGVLDRMMRERYEFTRAVVATRVDDDDEPYWDFNPWSGDRRRWRQ